MNSSFAGANLIVTEFGKTPIDLALAGFVLNFVSLCSSNGKRIASRRSQKDKSL
jgi:hypothetical protein